MYYFKEKCVRITLTVFAVLTFLFGIVVLIYAFVFKKSEVAGMLEEVDEQIPKYMFYFILGLAGFSVLTALISFVLICKPNCLCITLTSVTSFAFFALMLIFGVTLFLVGNFLQAIVKGEDKESSGLLKLIPKLDEFKDTI